MAGLLTLGARAMFANQAALQTIGQNIANANTPGYSRQAVVLTTSPGQFTGAGFFGKGVDVQTVVRSHNEFLPLLRGRLLRGVGGGVGPGVVREVLIQAAAERDVL